MPEYWTCCGGYL